MKFLKKLRKRWQSWRFAKNHPDLVKRRGFLTEAIKPGVENSTPYSKEPRLMLAEIMGIEDITSSTTQGKLRKLERNELITRNIDKTLQINNPHFKTWIKERIQDE